MFDEQAYLLRVLCLILTESDSSDDDSSSDEDLSLDVSLNEINGRLLNNAG